jgi:hypothetical protein
MEKLMSKYLVTKTLPLLCFNYKENSQTVLPLYSGDVLNVFSKSKDLFDQEVEYWDFTKNWSAKIDQDALSALKEIQP